MHHRKRPAATVFKQGHAPWNKGLTVPKDLSATAEARPVIRMGLEEFSLVTKTSLDGSSLSTPDCEGRSGNVRLLRPSATTTLADLKDTNFEGTRLIDNDRMIATFNEAPDHHRQASPSCLKPELRIADEAKFGLGWKITLECVACKLTTPQYKLYIELKTGRPEQALLGWCLAERTGNGGHMPRWPHRLHGQLISLCTTVRI